MTGMVNVIIPALAASVFRAPTVYPYCIRNMPISPGSIKYLISLHRQRIFTPRFLFSRLKNGKKMIVLIISGMNATVAELSLSPIKRITGTCVAHIKFTRSTRDQSIVFAGLNKLIALLLV
jgi:hypothetical protein